MIFTEAEMDDLWHDYKPMSCREYTRHVEAKLLAKLAQGVVMPEPVGYLDGQGDSYTADQLRTVAAAARVKALEDAAQVAEYENAADWSVSGQIAKAIRALRGAA